MGRNLSPIYLNAYQEVLPTLGDTARPRGGKLIAFGWYGGKFSHLKWLLPLLPECHHYCEPFAGSAAVLLNRPPSAVETYNDLDGEVVNFFSALRDQRDDLVQAIALTPFSREEFAVAIEPQRTHLSKVERARRFFIRARQARTGLAQTASLGRWANCKNTSRSGMSGVVSRWLGSVEMLPLIAERLLRVQIENRPAEAIVQLYDDPKTFFYCDPPYVHGARGDDKAYAHEMSDSDHTRFAQLLNLCKARIAVSGYQSDLYARVYKGWRRIDSEPKACHSTKGVRQESLWVNF